MTDTQRMGARGWFVRAFAAGFGAMCGVIAASTIAFCAYALLTAGLMTLASSGGGVPSGPAPLLPPPSGCDSSYPPAVQAAGFFVVPEGAGAHQSIRPCPTASSPTGDKATGSESSPEDDDAPAEKEEDSAR